jgi:hypothetical protein
MTQPEADQYRAALEEIVRIGTTPDTSAVGTLPSGEVGPLWSAGGQDKAFGKILRVAREALANH